MTAFEPKATAYSIMAGVGRNYRMMPNLFRDSDPLPMKSASRYCMFYWEECGLPIWQSMSPNLPVVEGTPITIRGVDWARLRKFKKTIGYPSWGRERTEEYLADKRLAESEKRARDPKRESVPKRRAGKTLDEIYYETIARAGRELSKPKPAEPQASLPQPYDAEADRLLNDKLRARLLNGRKPQDPIYPPLPREMTADEEALYWWGQAKEALGR